MIRTQVSVTEEQKRRLDELSATDGISLSELIRRAIDHCYPPHRSRAADLAAIDRAFGAWTGRELDGTAHVTAMRSGRRLSTDDDV
jgi:hypothetical protein